MVQLFAKIWSWKFEENKGNSLRKDFDKRSIEIDVLSIFWSIFSDSETPTLIVLNPFEDRDKSQAKANRLLATKLESISGIKISIISCELHILSQGFTRN